MPRYITIPPPVKLFHPDTGAPILVQETDVHAEAFFATAIRHLTNEIIKSKTMDLADALELRLILTQADVGTEVEIPEDAWWDELVETFKRPNGFHLAYLIASRPHVLAVTQATTEPRVSQT
jgi:hypothetical protein